MLMCWLSSNQDDDEEEIDDMIVKPTDAVIVAACTDEEDEYCYLQACNSHLCLLFVAMSNSKLFDSQLHLR